MDYKEQLEHFEKWKPLNEQFEAYQFMSGGLKRQGVHSLFAFNWRFRNQMAVRHIIQDIERYTQFVKVFASQIRTKNVTIIGS